MQDNSLKHLHYVDSPSKFPVRSGFEDLPDRFDIALITEIATANCAPPLDSGGIAAPGSPLVASPLSFSLLTPEGSLADAIAPDASRWADWTDGLNMLRRDSGHVASKETADFIQALTEIGLKIKLLGVCDVHLCFWFWRVTSAVPSRFVWGQSRDTQWADSRSATCK